MRLEDVVAVISGGASGVGLACARALLRAGARVTLMDKDVSRAVALLEELGETARFLATDVTLGAQINAALDLTETHFGTANVAINAAAVGLLMRTLSRQEQVHTLEAFQQVVDVNLVGGFNVARLFAERVQKRRPDPDGERGVVINIGSICASEGQRGQVAYAASMGGVAAMTLPMARDLGPLGVRVNTVAPGLVDMERLDDLAEEGRQARLDRQVFPKRPGHVDEVARLVCHMIENVFLNAAVVRLDGGARP